MYDIIIIGSGPAGLTAAIYAKRAQLSALVIEKDPRGTGLIAASEQVDNFPGSPGINGFDLGEGFRSHAEGLGAGFLEDQVISLSGDYPEFTVELKSSPPQKAKTIIYSAGTSYRKLGVPGDDKQRISYCAVCDGFFFKNKTAAVIGGGDTALGDALYLSDLAEKVYLIHRRNEFRANMTLQKQVSERANIIPVMNATLTEVTGGKNAEGIAYTQNGESRQLAADGIFAAVGSVPNTAVLRGLCDLDGQGYVIAGEDCRTSKTGVFAAGDVRTTPLRQVITAAADGARAATFAAELIRSSK